MIDLIGPLSGESAQLPLYTFRVPAGFPSPAVDHVECKISLDELLDIRAPHMYLVRIEGDSMTGAGIYSGDLIAVDRSIEAEHGHIVIAAINSEPVCKRLLLTGKNVILQSENPHFAPRHIAEGDELLIWGVVTFSVHAHEKG